MLLIAHIAVALSSLVYAGFVFISPSPIKVKMSYCLVGLTLVSGTALVIVSHAQILQSCLMGLAYLAFTLSATVLAGAKLDKI
jgi:hypothetical protein